VNSIIISYSIKIHKETAKRNPLKEQKGMYFSKLTVLLPLLCKGEMWVPCYISDMRGILQKWSSCNSSPRATVMDKE
jgi:hypothetical protein